MWKRMCGVAPLVVAMVAAGCRNAGPRSTTPDQPALPSAPAITATASPDPRRTIEIREQKLDNGMAKERSEGYVNDKGEFVLHGTLTRYFDDGAKQAELHFMDGKQHGERLTWYPSGQLQGRGYYDHGSEEGTWTAWFPNGFVQREWQMRDGTWHGVFTEYHDNGERKIEFEYVNGLKQGKMTIWNPEGRIIHQSEYVDDVEQP